MSRGGEKLQAPEGYQAIRFSLTISWYNNGLYEDDWAMVTVANRKHLFQSTVENIWYETLENNKGSIPITFVGKHMYGYAIGVEIRCKRTPRAIEQWRLDTHTSLYNGYLRLKNEAEEKMKALQVAEGLDIQGKNPEVNRKSDIRELKRQCISTMTRENLMDFNAINDEDGGKPSINFEESELQVKCYTSTKLK